MNELDFSGKRSSFRRLQRHRQWHRAGVSGQGRGVQVCGTRASAGDYSAAEGSDLEGLDYAQLDVGDAQAIEASRRRSTGSTCWCWRRAR